MDSSNKIFKCKYCEKVFQHRQSLSRHLKTVHEESSQKNWKSKCPAASCEEVFQFRSDLRNHIQDAHDYKLIMEEMKFSSFQEFENWKHQIEKQMKCCYILKQTPKPLASGASIYYYSCFRSGTFLSESTGKRQIKCTGSRKIDGCCTSSIDATRDATDGVKVTFWKTHFGHDDEIGHLFLSNDEKEEIVCKLKQGVTFERILDDVRDNIDGELQRIHLLTRKDLHNIGRDRKILNYMKLHNDDATSVKLWINTMSEAGEDSPVIFYKEQGEKDPLGKLKEEDFQLVIMTKFQKKMLLKFGSDKICIDSTHGTNSYSFQLTTLLVIDEFGSGCPVGFCMSNRVDETAMKVFFEVIKEKACTINCRTFMSDDAPAFFNAWVSVMGPPLHQLLCTWHVDRSWRKNLSKISGSQEKKALVYKALRVLLQEKDIEKFSALLDGFLKQLEEDEETKLFASYLKSHYLNRAEVWAFCHRPRLGINTNMHLESMHKVLKHFYLEGKKAKRLDKTVNMLMKLSRDKIFDRLIKFTKNVPSDKIKKIRNSHQSGVKIHANTITKINNLEWTILSTNNSYTVIKNENSSCQNCFYSCKDCNVCIHMYECTCLDNFIHFNICKHIHACVQLSGSSSKLEHSDKNEEINDILESCMAAQNTTKASQLCSSANLKQKALFVCNLLDNAGELDEKTSTALSNLLDKELSILRNLKTSSFRDEAAHEPPNKKVRQQPRFFSTKKTSNKKDGISKPSANEELSIANGLLGDETVNIHSDFDHIY